MFFFQISKYVFNQFLMLHAHKQTHLYSKIIFKTHLYIYTYGLDSVADILSLF